MRHGAHQPAQETNGSVDSAPSFASAFPGLSPNHNPGTTNEKENENDY